MATKILPRKIITDAGTQARAFLSKDTVSSYEEILDKLPPIVIFYDGDGYYLADGFHRLQAWTNRTPNAPIPCDIKQGTQRDAIAYSLSANSTHGLPRTQDDRRRSVLRALADDEWQRLNDSQVANLCQVSPTLVKTIRQQLANGDTPVKGCEDLVAKATAGAQNPRAIASKSEPNWIEEKKPAWRIYRKDLVKVIATANCNLAKIVTGSGQIAKQVKLTDLIYVQWRVGDRIVDGDNQPGEIIGIHFLETEEVYRLTFDVKFDGVKTPIFNLSASLVSKASAEVVPALPKRTVTTDLDKRLAIAVGKTFQNKKYNLDNGLFYYDFRGATPGKIATFTEEAVNHRQFLEMVVVVSNLIQALPFLSECAAVSLGSEIIALYWGDNSSDFKQQFRAQNLGWGFKK
jgi:hypothetical protein